MQICAAGTFSTGDYGYYTTGVDTRFLQMTTDDLLMAQEDLHIIVSVTPEESKEEILRRIKEQLEVYFTERDAKG